MNIQLIMRGTAFAALGLTHIALTIGYYVGLATLWIYWFVERPFVDCYAAGGDCTPAPKYWVPPARLFETDTEYYIAFCMLVVFHLLVRLLVYKAHEFLPSAYRWLLQERADAVFNMLGNLVGFLFTGLLLICILYILAMIPVACADFIGYLNQLEEAEYYYETRDYCDFSPCK